MKKLMFPILLCLLVAGKPGAAQDVFQELKNGVKDYHPDTSAVPNDKITAKIMELRQLKGAFNINNAVDNQMKEALEKKDMDSATAVRKIDWFSNGKGKELLDRAVIHIYREQFSYAELKKLVKFYQSSAGRKLASTSPLIMVESLRAAEYVSKLY